LSRRSAQAPVGRKWALRSDRCPLRQRDPRRRHHGVEPAARRLSPCHPLRPAARIGRVYQDNTINALGGFAIETVKRAKAIWFLVQLLERERLESLYAVARKVNALAEGLRKWPGDAPHAESASGAKAVRLPA